MALNTELALIETVNSIDTSIGDEALAQVSILAALAMRMEIRSHHDTLGRAFREKFAALGKELNPELYDRIRHMKRESAWREDLDMLSRQAPV